MPWRMLPASVSPPGEPGLPAPPEEQVLRGGSRAGERDRTCSSPPLPPRCPNAQRRNEAEPVLCTHGDAANTLHPAAGTQHPAPRGQKGGVCSLGCCFGRWLEPGCRPSQLPGSLQGLCKENHPPRADPAPCSPCAGGQGVPGCHRADAASGHGRPGLRAAPREALLHGHCSAAAAAAETQQTHYPSGSPGTGWGNHTAGCDPQLPHASGHGVWLCLCHAVLKAALSCLPVAPRSGTGPLSKPITGVSSTIHPSINPSVHPSPEIQEQRTDPATSFPVPASADKHFSLWTLPVQRVRDAQKGLDAHPE